MSRVLTDRELLHELEDIAEDNVNRHLAMAKDWHPHDYVPWDDGRNFAALGGEDWDPEQSQLSDTARAAMITNLLTEDNLPSYHREIAQHFSLNGAWGTWVGRWTAEENKHSIVMRDYLVVTRGSTGGARAGSDGPHDTGLRSRRRVHAGFGVVRDVPGTGHPGVAPEHG